MAANALMQAWFMSIELKPGMKFFINLRLLKVFVAGLAMALVGHYLLTTLWTLELNFLQRAWNFSILALAMVFSYSLILILLGEGNLIKRILRK